ncbi:MAG: glycosyltransferase family 9 protein [Selenomonadaceae bacterium]|nr:glycosyltransferase family 9 protein [Selenomonadaceae bacterium]
MEKFFDDLFRMMRKADPTTHLTFLERAEEEFRRQGYREEISSGVENILIVRLDAIGDMILMSGFLREVRKNFPHARITLVCSPLVRPIVELCPYVNEVLSFDKKNLDKNSSRLPETISTFFKKNFWRKKFSGTSSPQKDTDKSFDAKNADKNFLQMLETVAAFCRDNLWRKKFSIAFSPKWSKGIDSLTGLFMCWLSGARERIGFSNFPGKSWGEETPAAIDILDNFLLTKCIVTPRSTVTEIEKNFYLLESVGLKVNQTQAELFFEAADFIRARELLKNIPSTNKKVLLGIGAGELNRKYPVEKLLVALKELLKKDLVFVIVGGKSEFEDAAFLEKNLPREKVLNLTGKTTLRETEAIISQMDFYLGNDTGVMHIAAAGQIPCLVLYRDAADKEDFLPGLFSCFQRFPPWQTKSVILRPTHQLEECARLKPIYGWCHVKDRPHCIAQISPQEIIDGFEKLEAL